MIHFMAPVSRDLCPRGSIFRGNKPLNSPVTYFMKIAALSTGRGGTQEFELRSIEFKKYISGLRSIFLFQKKHNFA